ncbi:hypothetical protein ATL10_100589 [Bacillus sp. 196mf]|nr:hypothetical protein ATL10_100589 [Bacillus sp. 196mf]SFK39870.1 hypothetical protein SAMN04488573_101138 [Bacillus sp. 5mfcol3.1]
MVTVTSSAYHYRFVHFSAYNSMNSAWKDNEEIKLKLLKKPVKFSANKLIYLISKFPSNNLLKSNIRILLTYL